MLISTTSLVPVYRMAQKSEPHIAIQIIVLKLANQIIFSSSISVSAGLQRILSAT